MPRFRALYRVLVCQICALGMCATLRSAPRISFNAPLTYLTGGPVTSVALGDFNGDGKPDLAVTTNDTNTVSILFGNGDGTFRPAVNYPLGRSPGSIAIGDFNHDGNPDLAIVDGSGLDVVYILLGTREGTFQLAGTYGVGYYPSCVVAADFNGDGNLDLAVADSGYHHDGQGVSIILGNGDGTFQQPTQI